MGSSTRRRHVRPRVQHHDRFVAAVADTGQHVVDHLGRPLTRRPVVGIDIPEHIAVAQPAEPGEDAWIVVAGAERAAKPGSRIDSGCGDDGLGRLADVGRQALVAQPRHPCMAVRVVSQRMAARGDLPGGLWFARDPAALEKERGPRAAALQERGNPPGSARLVGPVAVLGVDGECHPQPAITHAS